MEYVAEDYEYLIKWRIPFTAYRLWKDPKYGHYRLVVRETDWSGRIYRYRII